MKSILKRIGAVVLACMMLAALCVPAMAVDIDDARAAVADVKITQGYNGKTNNHAQHNYEYDGNNVNFSYTAQLYMTDIMATYLQARQNNLCRAAFVVHINVESANGKIADLMELADPASTVTFSSTFLKPQGRTVTPVYQDGVFSYTLDLAPYWNGRTVSGDGKTIEIAVPMELIVYFDGEIAYGFSDLYDEEYNLKLTEVGSKVPMYVEKEFTVEDWMAPIDLKIGDFKVKDGVKDTVTSDSATWQTIRAYGTIDGDFNYAVEPVNLKKIGSFIESNYAKHLAFGTEESGIAAWKSNVVLLSLQRYTNGGDIEPKYLNTKDHFAYIIGYPETEDPKDWPVHPDRNITRAEVATIFFRMLTDEARNAAWKTTNDYSDVSESNWFNNAVSTLSNIGVINGYPDGTFKPNAPITRAEFASIAVRFFELQPDENSKDVFTDIAGHWARANINLAYTLRLVDGDPNGAYRPQDNILRCEAMKIMNNTLRRSPDKNRLLPTSEMINWPDNANTSAWYYAHVQEATNSHDYTRDANGVETWTKELPIRDWVQFEREWSTANSATNPGEVIGEEVNIKP